MSDIERRLRLNSDWRDERWRCITDPALLIEAADTIARLRAVLENIQYQAKTRIIDGDEMGSRVWRIALVDIKASTIAALEGEG